MKKGFSAIIILAVLGLLVVAGISGYVVATNYTSLTKPRVFNFLESKPNTQDLPSPSPNVRIPAPRIPSPTPTANSNDSGQNVSSTGSTSYPDPLGYYSMVLPSDWVVGQTNKQATYTTTQFDGPSGHIAITSGTGKDPIGGCSESSNVQLSQKSILGCFLLQKDGSQLLTRGYTNTSGGVQITVEAYINPPIETNKQPILDIIKTIIIN